MDSKKISLTVLLSTIFMSMALAESNTAPQSKPNKPLTKSQAFKRDFLDFILLEKYGYKGVNQETENYIRSIIKQMDMEDYNIEIRSMSNEAKMLLGRMNAFVYPDDKVKTELNYLFVSEEWFNSLTEPEKRALIGHELIHIRNNHVSKEKLLGSAILSLAVGIPLLILYKASKNINDPIRKQQEVTRAQLRCITMLLASLPIASWFSRRCEKEADIEGAKATNSAEGAVQLWQRFINETKDPKSRFAIKRALNKFIGKPLNNVAHMIFGSHPQLKYRKKYMEKLAQELKQEEIAP